MAVGTLADAPKDLLDEIKRLEQLFTIDTAKLKEITNHFVNELTKGKLVSASRPTDPSLTCSRSER
jgi:hexokinase